MVSCPTALDFDRGQATDLEFGISFFDVFMDVTLDRPSPLPPLHTTVGPIPVEAGVPEPAAWAMMLLGFVDLFFAGYRKAKSGQTALSD
jgi:hypothetical protein